MSFLHNSKDISNLNGNDKPFISTYFTRFKKALVKTTNVSNKIYAMCKCT